MSGRLNIMCTICSEFYEASAVVYSTRCGHLFHKRCLYQWLARSNSCPQCRQLCYRQLCHRIFLNYCERSPTDEVDSFDDDSPNWLPLGSYDAEDEDDTAYLARLLQGAIPAGTDPEGNAAYVARVYYKQDLLPANYVPALKGLYTPWGCAAHFIPYLNLSGDGDEERGAELLFDNSPELTYCWVASSEGQVPPHAVTTGYTSWGESLYTGRAQYMSIQLAGKVHPSHHVLYMPYKDQEVNVEQYEVLVRVPKEQRGAQKTPTEANQNL